MSEPARDGHHLADEVAVALCLYGEALDPAEVTHLLGTEPTHSHRKGELAAHRKKPPTQGAWIRELRSFEPIDPNALVEQVLAGMPPTFGVDWPPDSRFDLTSRFTRMSARLSCFLVRPFSASLRSARTSKSIFRRMAQTTPNPLQGLPR